ncbi:MAG TPA: hypothetical protein VNH16_12570 [Burkholderiales bacterium]|nr:hypothetical protein [Burkholderiales bacterium]
MFSLFDRQAGDIDHPTPHACRASPQGVNNVHFHPVERRALRATLALTY